VKNASFLARDVIYASRAYAMMPASICLSVCLSVTFVHCDHRVWRIPDIFACLDRWMSLLLTDNAIPGSSDGMMLGFLVEEGGMEKLVIVVISLILLIFYRWTGNTWRCWVLTTQNIIVDSRKCIMSEDGTSNYHIGPHRPCNISAKNYKNPLICVEVIVCYISVVFLRHSVHTHTGL